MAVRSVMATVQPNASPSAPSSGTSLAICSPVATLHKYADPEQRPRSSSQYDPTMAAVPHSLGREAVTSKFRRSLSSCMVSDDRRENRRFSIMPSRRRAPEGAPGRYRSGIFRQIRPGPPLCLPACLCAAGQGRAGGGTRSGRSRCETHPRPNDSGQGRAPDGSAARSVCARPSYW